MTRRQSFGWFLLEILTSALAGAAAVLLLALVLSLARAWT